MSRGCRQSHLRRRYASDGGCALPGLDFAQPPLKEPALAIIGDQRESPLVALGRFDRGAEAAEQIGTCGMQQVIIGEIVVVGQLINQGERRTGPSAMATATARFSDTMGEGCTRSRRS